MAVTHRATSPLRSSPLLLPCSRLAAAAENTLARAKQQQETPTEAALIRSQRTAPPHLLLALRATAFSACLLSTCASPTGTETRTAFVSFFAVYAVRGSWRGIERSGNAPRCAALHAVPVAAPTPSASDELHSAAVIESDSLCCDAVVRSVRCCLLARCRLARIANALPQAYHTPRSTRRLST